MTILVTGGAGYIGSHCVDWLQSQGQQVVILDNFSTGYHHLLRSECLVEGNTADQTLVERVLKAYDVTAVMHFAASCYVGESVENPAKYYQNNVVGTLRLLEAMRSTGVKQFVFSSSCATYGNPLQLPLTEEHPLNPINPYGMSKRMVEAMLADFSVAYGLRYVSLRYFNAAGAHPDGILGECHDPETHLIPLVLQAALGQRPAVQVFGTDYDTPDGTCIRDYIHIVDIAQAHALALNYLQNQGPSTVFNIGTETGHSVRDVITACEHVTGQRVPVIESPRRPGDPPSLVASAAKIKATLGWQPQYPQLTQMLEHAWGWAQNYQPHQHPKSHHATSSQA